MKKFNSAISVNLDDCEKNSNFFFQINNCGFVSSQSGSEKKYVVARKPRVDHMLIYFTREKSYYELNGYIYDILPGDVVYIEPNEQLNFGNNKHAQHYWIHFTGTNASEAMHIAGFKRTGIYHVGLNNSLIGKFNDIILSESLSADFFNLYSIGIFFEILDLFSHALSPTLTPTNSSYETILPAIKHLNLYFFENHPLDFYAELCDISVSSLKKHFKTQLHLSPIEYLHCIRIDKAKQLIKDGEKRINHIASILGYESSKIFSYTFKKYAGIAPSNFINGH